MDFSKISTPDPKTPRSQAAMLPNLDHWLCVVYARVTNRSMADLLRTAAIMYIRGKLKDGDIDRHLMTAANTAQCSTEELFMKIVNESSK